MLTPSRFHPSATGSPPHRRRRRVASLMDQYQAAPSGRSDNRSSSQWPRRGLGFDLGFLLGRRPRPGGEKLDPANWLRCVLSPPPTAEAEADGKAVGSSEEQEEVGVEEADHLVVTVNGLYGSSADWKFAAEQFVKRLPGKVFVHRSQSNHSKLTYDGVDIMGERLAEEVQQVVQRRTNLRKISFVAHSLGGLVARYAIGKLYEPSMSEVYCLDSDNICDEQKIPDAGKIAGLEPINFITSATPHLGSRLNKQAYYCSMSALRSFKRRVAYANMAYDHIVGWRTSSIRRQYELPRLKLTAHDKKYPHVINVDKGNPEECCSRNPGVRPQEESIEDSVADSLEELMIRGLTQVTWERVDVCIHESRLRYNAHHNIQVRIHPVNSDGEDVIYHMIDSFLL